MNLNGFEWIWMDFLHVDLHFLFKLHLWGLEITHWDDFLMILPGLLYGGFKNTLKNATTSFSCKIQILCKIQIHSFAKIVLSADHEMGLSQKTTPF